MSYCRKRKRAGETIECQPSRFLAELAQDDLRWAGAPLSADEAAREKAAGSERLKSLKACWLADILMAAIERVEVLKNGASAIYDSDDVDGEIYFIQRKEFQGAQAYAQYDSLEHNDDDAKLFAARRVTETSRARGYNAYAMIDYQQ